MPTESSHVSGGVYTNLKTTEGDLLKLLETSMDGGAQVDSRNEAFQHRPKVIQPAVMPDPGAIIKQMSRQQVQ